uniref:DNA REPAIR PROTEIN RAD52 HOMOLOG-BINDING PROTEIN, DNA REPAIR, DNA.7A n=2 Tax=unclassified Caudoviricetes TaxID=2788787 RepID=A0A8S5V3Q5_9CAUD|nr:MAG TPA: DNA REPAIR PROTEIN RAD52 HOMOLOG-BINDING PROTEIN, DNA REPAIR, DNA.7A [Podoviridae sp. ctoqT5]DAG01326.1 MAG TPA: DNA REPAIR PROTEIN RAD52 HOMOLOG-BINDING PROTEIN, DNA REPAIR, DNA.7A [Myoviridae sp. ctk6V34]
MNNLELYDKFRQVPETAKKNIGGGRLKGMTDINPMWRIKTLTEEFGVCGFGWYYEIVDQWLETAMAKDEITANVKINLYVKQGDEWSKPIVGIGGSMLVANEKNGLYVNDECYKMALTDAISVACKSLGIGADVYWNKDNTKYNDSKKDNQGAAPKTRTLTYREKLIIYLRDNNIPFTEVAKDYGLNGQTTDERFKEVLENLEGK